MTVRTEMDGLVGVITLDRPEKRNALDAATIDALADALVSHEEDAAVHAIVLTGTGDRAFCAGMDLTRVEGGSTIPRSRTGSATYRRLLVEGSSKPLVAAVNGTAVAGGFELVLAADLVVMADHALLGLPEVSRGLVPGAGGTFLPQRVPRAAAFEMALTGAPIDAARASALGLVNRVVPGDEVLPCAMALARTVAGNSPLAVRHTRRLLRSATEKAAATAWALVDATVSEVLVSEDAREGAQAFLERRAPRWP